MKGVNIDFCGGEIESAFIKTEWYYDQACGENAKLFSLKFKEWDLKTETILKCDNNCFKNKEIFTVLYYSVH